MGKKRPTFEDFKEIYSPEEIARDQAELKRLRGVFLAKEAQRKNVPTGKEMYPEYFEVINLELAARGFFGSTISASMAHSYDDVKRQTDFIFSVGGKPGYRDGSKSCAVDATVGVSTTSDTAAEKNNSINETLRHGELPELKYFSDFAEEEPLGRITMPGIILAVTYDSVGKLLQPMVRMKLLGIKNVNDARSQMPKADYLILKQYAVQVLQEMVEQLEKRVTVLELEKQMNSERRNLLIERHRVLLDRILHEYRNVKIKS